MGKKIYFQDGSAIEISTEILEPGEMATNAYKKILEFIEDELAEPEELSEDVDDLVEPDLDELDDDLELDLDDEDEEDDDLELDDDEWDEDDDDDERW